jgi:hypothetical protein
MALTSAGAVLLAQCLMNDSATFLNSTNAYVGVGDSNTAFSAAHTDLQAASNKVRKGMEATYPTRSSGAITLRALFGTGDANFTWAEWAVFNASSAGTMVSRKVEALGTKTSAQSWQATVTLTLAAA